MIYISFGKGEEVILVYLGWKSIGRMGIMEQEYGNGNEIGQGGSPARVPDF